MSYWVFKVSEQEKYPDEYGRTYVYDNLHSRRIRQGDCFLYLYVKKKKGEYRIVGTGLVDGVESRAAPESQRRLPGVVEIFTARLCDVYFFKPPVDLSSRTREGLQNRSRIGISDFNLAGWSGSIISIGSGLHERILDLAGATSRYEAVEDAVLPQSNREYSISGIDESRTWFVEDAWSPVKRRMRTSYFSGRVLERHGFVCAVCGTGVRDLIVAAHIRGWAQDKGNRANPANGIALCCFCHVAFDACLIAISPTGELMVSQACREDSIAMAHFSFIAPEIRRGWLAGINPEFLKERVVAFKMAEGHLRRTRKRSN
ncbi:HNH endonuclease [Archangium gephyra]|uniref:HNH endonuclease n=1 Tax=Archangium gephyra TaxID=48 RepID=UPI003B777794